MLFRSAGVHWLLSCVFLRFIEDNQLVDRPWLAGTPESGRLALARDRHEAYFRAHPLESDRDYLLAAFRESGTLPALRTALLQSQAPLLLVSAGFLARYDLMSLITEIEAAAGRPGHTPSVWLLLPTTHQGLPVIDGVAVPLVNNINNTQALALPQAWVENQHRAGLLHG